MRVSQHVTSEPRFPVHHSTVMPGEMGPHKIPSFPPWFDLDFVMLLDTSTGTTNVAIGVGSAFISCIGIRHVEPLQD